MNPTPNQTPNPFNYQPPKTNAKYILKCIFGVLFIISGIGTVILDHATIGGIMRIAAGLILFPPSLEAFERQFNTKLNRSGKYIVIIALIILSGIVTNDKSRKSKTATVTRKYDAEENYSDYLNKSVASISQLSSKDQAIRQQALTELQQDKVYQDFANHPSAKYLQLLNTLGICIRGLSANSNNMFLNDDWAKNLTPEQLTVMKCQLRVFIAGGFTKDMLSTFDKYKKHFGYYGEGGRIIFDANGNVTDTIKSSYNLVPIFAVVDSANKEVAQSIYETVSKGITQWSDPIDSAYKYPFLNYRMAYNDYLKQVDPGSPYILNYDYALTAHDLYMAYNANEVSADEKYKGKKLLVTGIVKSINKDIMGNCYALLSANGWLTDVHCEIENEQAASKLVKGNQYTFLGTCSGMVLTSVMVADCTMQGD